MNIDAPLNLLGFTSGYLTWPNDDDPIDNLKYIRGLANLFCELFYHPQIIDDACFSDDLLASCRWLPGVRLVDDRLCEISPDDPSLQPEEQRAFVRSNLIPSVVRRLVKGFGLTIPQEDIERLDYELLRERFRLAAALLNYYEATQKTSR